VLCSGLLISDLGRPERFLAMMRVFKPQSPISVGAWLLAGFGSASGAAAFAQTLVDRFGWRGLRGVGNLTETIAAVFALPFSNYTGILIGATAIPVWNHNIGTLPVHFGMSGLNSGVSLLELLGNEQSRPLNLLGMMAATIETYEGYHLELKRDPQVNEPLKHGTSGWVTRIGGVLSGPLPLALRLLATRSGTERARRLRRLAAWSGIVGSFLTRWGWVRAGHVSAAASSPRAKPNKGALAPAAQIQTMPASEGYEREQRRTGSG
jgi:hypothetical protein